MYTVSMILIYKPFGGSFFRLRDCCSSMNEFPTGQEDIVQSNAENIYSSLITAESSLSPLGPSVKKRSASDVGNCNPKEGTADV